MPRLVLKCPATGRPVPSGRTSLDDDVVEGWLYPCPSCRGGHSWRREELRAEVPPLRVGR
jgi:hypothetical protein